MVPAWQFPGWPWVSLALASPVAVWGAWPFHRAALAGARHGAATMDTLISTGVTAAYLWSLYALVSGGDGDMYLEVAAGVTALVLLGRRLEARARRRSGAAVRALLSLGAKDVAVLRGGAEVRIPAAGLAVGEEFAVRPGETIAADGVVIAGRSAIDTSMLTGEPAPAEVGPGDPVTGGCVNAGGHLVVRAGRVGADTQLAQLARLVAQAQAGKAPVQRLADRISAVFVPVVIGVAVATLAGWLAAGAGAGAAFTAAVAVLIIACPCAMGLATPTAMLTGTGRAAQLGIVIKGPEVLESTRAVDTVVLDKTGTVTTGRMSLAEVIPAPGQDADELLRLAGAVEDASEHPIGAAVAAGARERFGGLPGVEGFGSAQGLGVSGSWRGVWWRPVGRAGCRRRGGGRCRRGWLRAWPGRRRPGGPWCWPAGTAPSAARWWWPTRSSRPRRRRSGGCAEWGCGRCCSPATTRRAARSVADAVGIDEVIAGVLPAGKVETIRRLQQAGRVVAMAGDGVNDAAALAQADLGLAMGTGTDAAIEASDLTLVRGDLLAVPDAIGLSRRTLATIKGNLFWAFGYNAAAIPLAALGFLNPLIAAAAMAFSSVFVVGNSLRLRRWRPRARR